MNQIKNLIEKSLSDAREKVAEMRTAPPEPEEAPDLRQRLSKLAHVYDTLASDPSAVEKWAMDEDPTVPYSGTKSEDVQPPTDGDRSTSETQLHAQVESSPHTQQKGSDSVPDTNEDRDTLTTNDAPINAVSETPVGVPEKQAMLVATSRIFQAAEDNEVPDVSKIASDTGLSQQIVSDLLTHIVQRKTAAELPPGFADNVEQVKEEGTPKGESEGEKKEKKEDPPKKEEEKTAMEGEEKKEKKEEKPSDTSSTSPATDEEKKEVPPEKKAEAQESEAANTESHSSPEQPEVFQAGERGPTNKEIPFLGSPEATTAFKKRQAKMVSNSDSLGGVLDTQAYKDPTLHQQFENAESAGVKTTP